MAKKPLQTLYESLRASNYDVPDNYGSFERTLTAPGKEGVRNRQTLYKALRDNNYDVPDTYESFSRTLFSPVKPTGGTAASGQSMLPADVEERRMRTRKPQQTHPLNKSRARQRLQAQQQAIENQQKRWEQQNQEFKEDIARREQRLPGGMDRFEERAKEHLATGEAAPVPLAPNDEVVRGDIVFNPDTGRMEQTYTTPEGGMYFDRNTAEFEHQLDNLPADEIELLEREQELIGMGILRRGRELEQEYESQSWWDKFMAGLATDPEMGPGPRERMAEDDEELQSLLAAWRKNRDALRIMYDKRNNDMNSFWHNFGTTVANGYTFTGGEAELHDAQAILNSSKRMDEIQRKIEAGEKLSNVENAALSLAQNTAWDNAIQAMYGDDYGAWATAGGAAVQSLEMMPEFIAGMPVLKGMGTAAIKLLTRNAAKGFGRFMLKGLGMTLGTMAGGAIMANTIQAERTLGKAAGKAAGSWWFGDDGEFMLGHYDGDNFVSGGESLAAALFHAEQEAIPEAASEGAGEFLPGIGQVLSKIGLSRIAKPLATLSGKGWYKTYQNMLKAAGWHGVGGEALEEYVGTLDGLIIGDLEGVKRLADPRTHFDIWLSCATLGPLLNAPVVLGSSMRGVYSPVAYHKLKAAVTRQDKIASFRLTEDRWVPWRDRIDNTPNEQMADLMVEIRDDQGLAPQEKKAIFDYVKALQGYRGWNLGEYIFGKDAEEDGDGKSEQEQEQSQEYSNGYETVTPEERRAAKDRLDVARARLGEHRFVAETLDGMSIEEVTDLLNLDTIEDEDRAVLQEYINARTAYDGMLQRVNDDIDDEVAVANEAIDQRIAPEDQGGDGMIHPAVLKGGREVFIISGNVATLADNSIDIENSDGMIIVRDAEGNEDTISPDNIQSLGEVIDPAQQRQDAEQMIIDEQGQAAAAQIEGQLPFNVGDQYTISYQGEPHTYQVVQADENNVAVLVDGGQEPVVLTKQQLQQMADEERAEQIQAQAAAADAVEEEPAAVEPEQPVEAPAVEEAPAAPVAPEDNPTATMPMDDQGEPAWDQVEPERGHQFLYQESGWPQAMADNFVQKRIDDAEKALTKAQEAGQKLIDNPKPTFSAQQQAVAENTAAQQAAQSALDYWKGVQGIQAAATAPVVEETAPVVETPAEQEPTEQAAPVAEVEEPAAPAEPEAVEPVEETPAVETPAPVAENEMQPVEVEQPAEAAPAEPAAESAPQSDATPEQAEAPAEGGVVNATDETAPAQSDDMEMPNTLPGNHIELNYESGKDAESRAYIEEVMEREGWDEDAKSEFRKILDDAADLVSRMAQGFTRLREWNNKKLTDEQGNYNPLWRVWDKAVGWIPNRSSFKKNGEYPYNIDLGALCTKREAFDAVVRYIKEQGWGQNLGPTQIEALKSLLREHGFLTACDICFNETKRARALDYGNAVAYYWNAVRQAVGIDDDLPIGTPRELTEEQMKILTELSKAKNGKAFSKYIPKAVRRTYETYTNTKGERKTREADKGLTPTMTAKVAKLFLQDPSLMGRFEGTTLLSTDSVDALVRQHPQTDIAEFIAGAWGSATPKPNEGFNIYDPLSWKQAYDKKRQRPAMDWFFNLGGFRAQSFSDYHPIFFYDYVQMFTDLAIRRLPIHIYTKVPALIKLFGGTGAKFNMSLVPEVVQGVDAEHLGLKPDGNGGWELAWHEDSFPVDEAFALREDPRFMGNVGTIAVGISDAHIRMLLDDPRIDMVIPYHKSGMPKSVQIKTGLNKATDYTDDQHSKKRGKALKNDFSFNEALRRLGDPRKAADEYLAWCKGNNYTPKYPQFVDHPNYYKVLEDFRCIDNEGNYSPQQPVQVSFFDDVEQRLSESLEDRTMQEGLDTAIRGNAAITEGIEKIMSKPRLDGKIRDMMLARLKQVLGKDNVASLKQEDFFEELQKVYTDQMGAERAQQQVEVLRTSGGIVYGFAVGNRIVLNENYFNAETPMHEFTHVWVKVARLANPQMWADGKELLKQTKEWQEVMSDEFYRDIQGDEDAVASEVLARIVGQDAARQINEMFAPEDKPQERPGIYNKIKQWIDKFLDGVRSLFDSKAKGLTYDELVRMPMKALFDDAEAARFMKALQQVNEEDVDLSSQGSVPTFYSNAERAVQNVKQNKATAEQWKAMLTKQGGIKAGEDKWMGLSAWLDEHKGETLTKDEVRQFVADNAIQMEEVNYEDIYNSDNPRFTELQEEYDSLLDNVQAIYDENAKRLADFVNELEKKYGEDWSDNEFRKITPEEEMTYHVLERNKEQSDPAIYGNAKVAFDEMVNRYGDDFAIAFSGNKNGLYISNSEYAAGFLDTNAINETRLDYTTPDLENKREIAFVVPNVEPYQEHDEIHFGPENQGRAIMWVRFGETTDTDGNRVLVIDEVQSNRHQAAREKGYADPKAVKAFNDWMDAKAKEFGVQPYQVESRLSDEEYHKMMELANAAKYDEGAVPAAPFEKNWHEVAMKRMLRLAAEEGFDKVAWTTGMQQAERYSIGKVIDSIHRTQTFNTGETRFDLMPRDDSGSISLFVKDGVVTRSGRDELEDKPLEEVVGKEVAQKMLGMSDHSSIDIADMEIGGEGMKSFYDKMLPQFMNKYGKRWGVKVGEVTLDTPGKETMHSVDVTPEMRRSVMTEGQPLFQINNGGNTTAHETDQTKSANFKRWFGDWENDPEHASKVVDAEGRPLVVYHQTNAKRWINRETGEDWEKLDWRKKMEWENKSQEEWEDAWEEQDFYTFDDRYARQSIEMPAIFFSPENDPHHEYGNRTIAVYLNMRNPAINPDIPNRGVTDTAGRDAMEALKAQGYDGFIRTDEDGNIREYGVFDSNQVKSADENNGDFDPNNPDIRFRDDDEVAERDREYQEAVEKKDDAAAQKLVDDAAKAAGMATDENGKLIDLYHGTDRFGFTIFDRLKSRMGAFFTSTRRNVAANYAGDDHYAGVRKINKGYKQDDSQEGILNNARSVFDQDWKMVTEEQKKAIVTKVEADARKVADEIDKRRVDAETLPADEDLDIFNAVAWVEDLFYTVAYAKENGNEGEDLYRLVADGVERYNENKQVIRDYVSKHYDELDEKQKNYLNYLTGWDSGDVAIDIECSYKRVVSGKDLATVTGDSMLTLDELKKNTDEAHNIGAYHLFGNLGDNPLVVDAEGKNWYSLEYEGRKFDTDTLAQYAKENGYTALVVKNVYDYGDKADDYIFFEPSQLKSADPATYDDNGELIPLSQRFDLDVDDMRFREILEDGGTLKVYQREGKWRVEGVPGEFDTQFGAVDNARNFLQGHVFEVAEDGNSIEVLGAGSNLDNMLGADTAAQQRPTQQATAKQRKAEERARKWRERTVSNGRRRVEELGQRLGVKVTIVDDMSEQEREGMSKKKRRAKGWYDVRTGEVFINLGNHKTVSDIEATFLHEVVAHKGLRRLFGDEFDTFLHNVYYNVDESIREEINRLMAKNNWDYREATEEYLAKLAQQMNFERPEKYVKAWETVARLFRTLLQKMGLGNGMNLKDSDLRGILFESYHNMEKEGVAGLAESVEFRDWMEREANRRVDNATYQDNTNDTGAAAENNDREYFDAVERGDMATAGKMVKEAAQRAMPDTKVVDEEGKPLVMWHGGSFGHPLDDFNPYIWYNEGAGGWFSSSESYANNYTRVDTEHAGPIKVYLNIRNPFDMGDVGRLIMDKGQPTEVFWDYVNRLGATEEEVRNLIDWFYVDDYEEGSAPAYAINRNKAFVDLLKAKGFDGAHTIEFGSDAYMITDPAQIKSAETVTRDDNGNVIPLSERFNPEKEDIRFRDDEDELEDFEDSEDFYEEELEEEADNAEDLGEEVDDSEAGPSSFQEMMLGKMLQAANSAGAAQSARVSAMRSLGGALQQIRKAMSAQRNYDRETVNTIVRLAREVMASGYFNDLTRGEVKRLLAAAKNANGSANVTEQANKVVDTLLRHHLRECENLLKKQLKVKGSKTNASGVEVQAGLDIEGQRMATAMKQGMRLDDQGLSDRVADCLSRMGSSDPVVAAEASQEWTGLLLAQQYHENIKASRQEEQQMREEMRQAKAEFAARRDSLSPEELKRQRQDLKDYIAATEDAIRQNRMERADAYNQLSEMLGGGIASSMERAKQWRDEQRERVGEIQHNANSDLQDVPADEHMRPTWKHRMANWAVVRFFMKPLATFDYMLRMMGQKSPNGEGYLWNRFMGGWVEANDKEWRNIKAAHQVLDEKVKEVFNADRPGLPKFKVKRWSDLFFIERKMEGMDVDFWDGDQIKRHTLTPGNLLYIYMVDKMSDGKMKLRKMGMSDADVEAIKNHLDPRLIELADWLQDEFLVQKRIEYNAVHERMFGAPMAAIENYFPLKINSRSRSQEEDVNNQDANPDDNRGSTITGAIIKRVRNNKALDVTGADAFDVILEHIQNMEHWAAFAEFNRDLNTLLSYKRFRNRILNMSSARFGSGQKLWTNFKRVCAIASGVYRPKVDYDSVDTNLVNVAKGVTRAKISFRFYTALKQLLSYPAYLSTANPIELIKSSNPVGAVKAWNWALDNLPGFAERWQSRQAGDTRLKESDADWGLWKSKIIDTASRWGMSPNAFIDGLTVAMGAKAIYETKFKQLKKLGYSEDKAKQRALRDASVAYNETQQSSANAYTSAMQLDRTAASVALTVFRNASMGYQRRLFQSFANLKHMATKGYKEQSLYYLAKQMERDGLDIPTAKAAAEKVYNRALYQNIADVAIFGWVMQAAWNLGAYLPYLFMGDDDDDKKEMLTDAALHAIAGGIEGLTGGSVISDTYNSIRSGEANMYSNELLPLLSDIESLKRTFKKDVIEGANDLVNLIIQAGVGVNPQTITDWVVAGLDVAKGDPRLANEFGLLVMRVMSAPQGQLDKLYIDELGLTAGEAKQLNAEEFAQRYARYKMGRESTFTGWAYSDEGRNDAFDRYVKNFDRKLKERIDAQDIETLADAYDRGDGHMKGLIGKAIKKKIAELDDTALQSMTSNNGNGKITKIVRSEINKRAKAKAAGMTPEEFSEFNKRVKSSVANASDEELRDMYNQADTLARKIIRTALDESIDPEVGDPYKSPNKEYGRIYNRIKTADDMEEDILLAKAQKVAKAAGDDDLAKEIASARSELTEYRKELTGGAGDAQVMKELREARKELINEYVKSK